MLSLSDDSSSFTLWGGIVTFLPAMTGEESNALLLLQRWTPERGALALGALAAQAAQGYTLQRVCFDLCEEQWRLAVKAAQAAQPLHSQGKYLGVLALSTEPGSRRTADNPL
jgi:hypothetical protein